LRSDWPRMPPEVLFEETPRRRYTVDGKVVPSVTTVLGCLDKPGMSWWGMQIGVDGMLALLAEDDGLDWALAYSRQEIVDELVRRKLSVNHVRDQAATRGTSLHSALENYLVAGVVPKPTMFPTADRGYVQALARALVDLKPQVEATEVIVGSALHEFAGRYDLRAWINGKLWRLDLKSSKRVYDVAHLQLAAYELAAVEMGEAHSAARGVLRLDASGSYELVESFAQPQMFLSVLGTYRALQRLRQAQKAGLKAAA
jgi:hypothetical protein